MTAMSPLRPILNDTPASATDSDWNFQTIEDYVAIDVIHRDGSVAMEAPLNLLGAAPSLASHAVPKSYVDNAIPVGTIWQFAGGPGVVGAPATVPAGWVLCDGAQKSTTDPLYTALFAVIQYAYGGAGGNFNLPNLGGRMPIGRVAGDALFGVPGQAGGSRDLVLPSHTHTGRLDQFSSFVDTNHTHDLQNHQHYTDHSHAMPHVHNSPLRTGYDINNANAAGQTNAVYPAQGNASLIFTTRPSAATESQLGGGAQYNTGQPADNANTGNMAGRQYTDPPNINGTGWSQQQNASNHRHAMNCDVVIGTTGVGPANANVQPYVTVNFIIRIG